MLLNLPSVLQRIEVAISPGEVLNRAVQGIKTSLAINACSIYVTEPGAGECVLRATDGQDPHTVGSVRFNRLEDLVGSVLGGGQVLSVEHAKQHLRQAGASAASTKGAR